jgi:hypothetical protein
MEQEGQQEELEKRQIGTKKTHIILLTIDNEYDLCTGLQWHLDNGRQFERKYVGEFRIHQIPLNSAFLRKYNQHFPDLEDWNVHSFIWLLSGTKVYYLFPRKTGSVHIQI